MKRKLSRLLSLILMFMLLVNSMPAMVYASDAGLNENGSITEDTFTPDSSENEKENNGTPTEENSESEEISEKDNEGQSEEDSQMQIPSEENTESEKEEPSEVSSENTSEVPGEEGSEDTSEDNSEIPGGVSTIDAVEKFIYIDKAAFPDDDFRNYVLTNYDTNKNKMLNANEIAQVKKMDLKGYNFSSLEGIEYFTELTVLYAEDMELTELNVSGLKKLEELKCNSNKLEVLKVEDCYNLKRLECEYGKLKELDVRDCVNLNVLLCGNNMLETLNISNNIALQYLDCQYNDLTTLDISNNAALLNLNCSSNNLEELDVSNNMALEYINCEDNKLSELDVTKCIKLEILNCVSNSIRAIDLSNNTALQSLYCDNNLLTELEVNHLTGLEYLECSNNQLTSMDVSNCSQLKELNCGFNTISSLSFDGCKKLEKLSCENNLLSDIDVSNCINLEELDCSNNNLTDLDVSKCKYLECLYCVDNGLSGLNVSSCSYLEILVCDNNELTSLDTSYNKNLFLLSGCGNMLSTLICSSNTKRLMCSDNQLTALDLTNCRSLISLDCYNNRCQLDLKQDGENYYFDLSALPKAFDLTKCSEWTDKTTGTKLNGPDENLYLQGLTADTQVVSYRYNCGNGYSVYFTLNTENAVFSPGDDLEINEENFPNAYFRDKVKIYDLNGDLILDDAELEAVTQMTLRYYESTEGLEYFTSLVSLTVEGLFEDISIQNLPKLETIDVEFGGIETLSIKNCPKLKSVKMDGVLVLALEIENCPKLQYLSCLDTFMLFANLTGLSLIEAKGLVNEDGSIVQQDSWGVEMDENRQIDLSSMIELGFKPERTSGWDGGTLSGNILTVNEGSGEVRFFYDCGSGIVIERVWVISDIEGLWISSVPEQLYTGSAIKPKVDVYSGNKKLVLGKDYTISYKNNVNAGDADSVDAKGKSIAPTIVIKGKGNYTGTAIKTFTINPINLDNVETDAIINSALSIEPVVAAYTGKIVKGKPVIKVYGKTMSSSLYTLEYNDSVEGAYIEEGCYDITIKGKGTNVIGSLSTKEYISKKIISKTTISFDKSSFVYDKETGITHPGKITVKSGTTILEEGKDYFISYRNDNRIGTATVVITGNEANGWYGQKTKTYKITGKKLTGAMVKQLTKAFDYDRERQSVSSSDYKIYDGTTMLKENVDYVVTYPGPEKSYINAGSFKVTFTGIGAYTGAVTKTWKIQKISLETLYEQGYLKFYNYGVAMYTKAGGKANPDVYVDNPGYYNDYYLTPGVDYTVTCVNNSKVANSSDAKAPYFFITGKGNYTGTTKKNPKKFSIIAADISSTGTILADDVLYKDKKGNFLPKLSVVDNATGKKLSKGKDYDSNILYEYAADGEDNWVTLTSADRVDASAGRIKMRVTVFGKGSYSGSLSDTYEVYPKSINTSSIVVSPIPSQEYTGKAIKPKVTVSLKEKDGKTYKYTELTEGVDYTVEYRKNREKGTAIVFIYGKGQYGGVKKATFKITGMPIEWWKDMFSAF